MTQEDYVSFETAKLLKEKGFNEPCTYLWIFEKTNNPEVDDNGVYKCPVKKYTESDYWNNTSIELYKKEDEYWNDNIDFFACPTLQMAMKWLREVHHLFIGIEPRLSFTDYYRITANVYRVRKKNSLYHAEPVDDYSCVACCDGYSFEDACESAIKYCLEKLI